MMVKAINKLHKLDLRFSLLLLLLLSRPAVALKEYYSLSDSVRALGMGGAFYGLSNDESALFYNPAGLALYEGEGKAMFSLKAATGTQTFSAIKKIQDLKNSEVADIIATLSEFRGKPVYANFSLFPFYLTKNFALGLLIADTKIQVGILGKDIDTQVDLTAITDNGLIVGYARPLFDPKLMMGMNVKALLRAGGKKSYSVLDIAKGGSFDIDPASLGGSGGGMDVDLGGIYEVPRLPMGITSRASLTFSNLFASDLSLFGKEGNPPKLERMLSLGWHSILEGYGVIDNIHFLLDLAEFHLGGEGDTGYGARLGSFWKHVNWGFEAPIHGWLILRSGFHQGYFTAGVGIRTSVFEMDAASYAVELFEGINRLSSRRFAVRLVFGSGSPPPPPVAPRSLYYPAAQADIDGEKPKKAEKPKTEKPKTNDKPEAPDSPSMSPEKAPTDPQTLFEPSSGSP